MFLFEMGYINHTHTRWICMLQQQDCPK